MVGNVTFTMTLIQFLCPPFLSPSLPPSLSPPSLSPPNGKLVDNFSHESDVTSLQETSSFPGIEPMFDRCVCFGLLSTSDDDLGRKFIFPYGTFSSADASNLLIPINGLLYVGLKPSIYGRAERL